MPTTELILAGVERIVNEWRILAGAWHAYYFLIALGLAAGLRPSKKIAGILLALPLFSVSALAWNSGNPFNGSMFAAAGLALLIIALRLKQQVQIGPKWAVIAGSIMFAFGWIYPHFLNTSSFLTYLYAAPTGLIPCPTLSITIGLALIIEGFNSRPWTIVLGAMGTFYGLFGAVRLGVTIDWLLFAGAVFLVMNVKKWEKAGSSVLQPQQKVA